MRAALTHFFGCVPVGVTIAKLTNPRTVLVLGVPPVRIDLLTQMDGPKNFAVAWKRKVNAPMGDSSAFFLSREDLIVAKLAAGRPQDLLDAANLQRKRR